MHWKMLKDSLDSVGCNKKIIQMADIPIFLLMSPNLFDHAIFRIVKTKQANTKIIIGRSAVKKSLNIELFGANALISVFSINQSNDRKVPDELIFCIGRNKSVISVGNFILNESVADINCK